MLTAGKHAIRIIGDPRQLRAKEAAMKRKLATLTIFGVIYALMIANVLAAKGTWLFEPYTGSG